MTHTPVGLSHEQQTEEIPRPRCVICGEPCLHLGSFVCTKKTCYQQYQRKMFLAHQSQGYREYRFWYEYTVKHIFWSEGLDYTEADLY